MVGELTENEPVPEPMATAPVNANVPTFEPRELYNDGTIIVTADFADLYYDDYTVFMTVINESPSDIIVGTDLLSVNGYMHSSSLYAEVDAGEMVQDSLQLYTWELEQAGIEEVAQIAFQLTIYDQHDYSDIARTELITIETDIADTYEQPEFMDGWELYRDEDLAIRLVSTALYGNDCELLLHMENLTDQTIGVSVPEAAINGKPVDGSFWTMLRLWGMQRMTVRRKIVTATPWKVAGSGKTTPLTAVRKRQNGCCATISVRARSVCAPVLPETIHMRSALRKCAAAPMAVKSSCAIGR